MRACRIFALTGLLLVFAIDGARANDADSAAAVAELKKLYIEFQLFKNDPEFHAVGYGRCCEYYQWMKNVDALRGGNARDFLSLFGILPSELIALGREYYNGRGNGETAQHFESLINWSNAPSREGSVVKNANPKANDVIGVWIYMPSSTWKQTIAIKQTNGKLVQVDRFHDGSSRQQELVELTPRRGQTRRFRPNPKSPYGEYLAILIDGRLALYDSAGLIGTATQK
ncbi:MAG: hypothetical protein OXG99_01530 [Alphaproteobacteria bacterium]|nr:hypothetical protein [Alphaproteobacteria bacterium]